MIEKATSKSPFSWSNIVGGSEADAKSEQEVKDGSPIPGAWQDSKGSGNSSKPDQPAELAALAQKAKDMSTTRGDDLEFWDFADKLE